MNYYEDLSTESAEPTSGYIHTPYGFYMSADPIKKSSVPKTKKRDSEKKAFMSMDYYSDVSDLDNPEYPSTTPTERQAISYVREDSPEDLAFWRNDEDYSIWLKRSGRAPETTEDWVGAKLYPAYIKYKAENPTGLAWVGAETAKVLGEATSVVVDGVMAIPIINKVAPHAGSVLKFVGNFVDIARNVVAATTTALFSGHPTELLSNAGEAVLHGLTSGTKGELFSFTDAIHRNLVDNARKGMTDSEFRAYIDSDSYRQTKRLYQTGGLLLDMVLDPVWLMGGGATKAGSLFKEAKTTLGARTAYIGEQLVDTAASFAAANKEFLVKTESFYQHVVKDTGLAGELLGLSSGRFQRTLNAIQSLSDGPISQAKAVDLFSQSKRVEAIAKDVMFDMNTIAGAFTNSSVLRDKFGYQLNIYKPFTKRKELVKAIPLPLHQLYDTIKAAVPAKAESLLSAYKFGGIEKFAVRTAEGIADRTTAVKMMSDMDVANFAKHFETALPEIKQVAERELGRAITMDEAQDILGSVLTHKKPGAHSLTTVVSEPIAHDLSELGYAIVGKGDDVLKVVSSELAGLEKIADNILELESVKALRDAWTTKGPELLEDMQRSQQRLHDLLVERGLGVDEVVSTLGADGAVAKESVFRVILDDENLHEVLGSDLFRSEFISTKIHYRPNRLRPEFMSAVVGDMPEKAAQLNTIKKLFDDHVRLNYLPVDIRNPALVDHLFDGESALRIKSLLGISGANRAVSEARFADGWHAVLDAIRRAGANPETQVVFNKLIENGLIQYYPADFMNALSSKGWIARGVQELMYDVSGYNMSNYVKNVYDFAGQVSGMDAIFKRGLVDGFLKPRRTIELHKATGENILRHAPPPAQRYMGTWDWAVGRGLFENYYMPKFLVGMTESVSNGILKNMNPLELRLSKNGFVKLGLKALASFHRWWRPQMTLKRFGFHSRNHMTNNIVLGINQVPFNPFGPLAKEGLELAQYGKLRSKIAQLGDGAPRAMLDKLSELRAKKYTIGNDAYSIDEVFSIMLDNFVVGNNIQYDMIDKYRFSTGLASAATDARFVSEHMKFASKVWGSKFNIFGTNDFLTKFGQSAATYIEEGLARIPMFLHMTRQGMSIPEAGRMVNHMFVDYGRLSAGERAIRSYLIPFYTWQAKMVGVMLGVLGKSPGYVSAITKIQNGAYRLLDLHARLDSEFERDTEGIPILTGVDDIVRFFSGKPMAEIDVRFFASERFIPQTVLNLVEMRTPLDLLNPANYVKGLARKATEMLSPVVKYPLLELPTGTRNRGLLPFSGFVGDRTDLGGFKLSKELKHVLTSLSSVFSLVDETSRLWSKNHYTGEALPFVDYLINNFVGWKSYSKKESLQIYNYIKELETAYNAHVRMAKHKHSVADKKYHYGYALQARYGIDALKWLQMYLLEQQEADRYQLVSSNKR